jgi:DNA-binding IclR family transcriptional regulator
LDQNEALYVDKVVSEEKPGGLQMVSRVGLRVPAHCSSVGKVFLSQFSDEELESLANEKGLEKRTQNTIADIKKLKRHLKDVRQQGYAIDEEENEPGIRCIGAPVFNQQNQMIAAISISGPTIRVTKEIVEKTLKHEVLRTALEISREFGYRT